MSVHLEFGSHFHWVQSRRYRPSRDTWFDRTARFYGSGRMALSAVLDWGHKAFGWQRLWLPSYYCEPVVATLSASPVRVVRYGCSPVDCVAGVDDREGDVLVVQSCFGWGFPDVYKRFAGPVIADCSHDLDALTEPGFDYAFASLRKSLPIPDGGILIAGQGGSLPAAPASDDQHQATAERRLAAMLLKSAGRFDGEQHKDLYRAIEASTESAYDLPRIAAMSDWSRDWLDEEVAGRWRDQRLANGSAIREMLLDIAGIEWLEPESNFRPAYAVLRCQDADKREALRGELIERAVYPAVLWPPPEGEPEWFRRQDREFSETTLCLHVDGRYRSADMHELARRVRDAAAAAGLA